MHVRRNPMISDTAKLTSIHKLTGKAVKINHDGRTKWQVTIENVRMFDGHSLSDAINTAYEYAVTH
jgi:hypothetical protein